MLPSYPSEVCSHYQSIKFTPLTCSQIIRVSLLLTTIINFSLRSLPNAVHTARLSNSHHTEGDSHYQITKSSLPKAVLATMFSLPHHQALTLEGCSLLPIIKLSLYLLNAIVSTRVPDVRGRVRPGVEGQGSRDEDGSAGGDYSAEAVV